MLAMEDATTMASTGAPTANSSTKAICPGSPQTVAVETTATPKLTPLSRANEPKPIIDAETTQTGIRKAAATPPLKARRRPSKASAGSIELPGGDGSWAEITRPFQLLAAALLYVGEGDRKRS